MKTSFCTIAFQKNKWGKDIVAERPLTEILPIIAKGGFDAAELWWPHVSGLNVGQKSEVKKLLADQGLAASLASPYFDFTRSEESAAASNVVGRRVIEDIAYFGGKGVRVFTGTIASAAATSEQWDRAVHGLQRLAETAAAEGLMLACETHPHNLMDTVESSLELMQRVDRPNVGLIYQASTFAGDPTVAPRLMKYIRHVHMTNNRGKTATALADGEIDNVLLIRQLAAATFDGYISVEWMGEDPAGVVAREGPWLRQTIAGASSGQ